MVRIHQEYIMFCVCSLMKSHPHVALHVGHTVVQRMSSFMRQTDFALDWMQIEAGRALFRQANIPYIDVILSPCPVTSNLC